MQIPIVFLFVILLNVCGQSDIPKEIQLNQEFDLRFHDTALVQTEQLWIQFSTVLEDSRCPKGDQCITQGNARIELQIRKGKHEATAVQLNTDRGAKEAIYNSYKIIVIALNPYPVSGEQINSSRYVAILLITTA